jgi:hypothetical protein
MGVVFRQVEPHYLTVLREWLLAAMQEIQSDQQGTTGE